MPAKKKRRSYQVKKFGALEFRSLHRSNTEWCSVKHSDSRDTRKFATWGVYILGNPAGYVCPSCMKEQTKIWRENSFIEY